MRLEQLVCITCNAGASLSEPDASCAFLNVLSSKFGQWHVAYISESDGHLTNSHVLEFASHPFFRHYLPGSKPMGFLIHSDLSMHVQKVVWHGRAGAVHLFQKPRANSLGLNTVIFGIHGGHGDELSQSLADLSWLSSKFPRNARRLFLGDWNVDQLPALESDPFQEVPNRTQHHFERRCLLDAWADSLSVQMHLPDIPLSTSGGEFDEFCLHSPITRIPFAGQDGLPSVLDYAFSDAGLVLSSSFDWKSSPSDHALVAYICNNTFHAPHRKRKLFKPFNSEQLLCLMSEVCITHDTDVQTRLESIIAVQNQSADQLTCRERRAIRMPDELRQLYRRVSLCTNSAEAWRLRRQAWAARKQWIASCRLQAQLQRVQRGGVLWKSKKLYPIRRLHGNSNDAGDRSSWPAVVKSFYDTKWGVDKLDLRHQLHNFIDCCGEGTLEFTAELVSAGFKRLRNKSKLDSHGISVLALEYLFVSQSENFTRWLSNLASSTVRMSEFSLQGLVFGKESADTDIHDTRIILPLPSVLGLLDAILPSMIEPYIEQLLPCPKSVWFGALPRTQVLDISHGLTGVVEKALDLESSGAIGQSDVRQFFDTNNLLRVFRFLTQGGLPHGLAAACLRHQMLPRIECNIGSGCIQIGPRGTGSITGSRLAGMAARVPIQHACCSREPHWRQFGFSTPSGKLTLSTYVDNLFAVGRSCYGVTSILDDIESFLSSNWGTFYQTFEPSSSGSLPRRRYFSY